jgi:hypothetical protein
MWLYASSDDRSWSSAASAASLGVATRTSTMNE